MPFDPPAISEDPDEITDRILDGLTARIDGWEPVEGAPEVALAEELGREIADMNQTTATALEVAVAGIGETVFGFPAYPGVAAQIEVDITVTGTGTIIPAGLTVVGINSNNDEVAFTLAADIGADALTEKATMTAIIVGDIGNAVPAGTLTVVTATSTVVSVVATNASTNGADPERIDQYLDRLTDYLSTLHPGGVNGADLATLARTVPGVHRALGVDLYNPANPAVPAERTVTVFPIDEGGHAVSAGIAEQVREVLAAVREVNFVVNVAAPQYTQVRINFAAVCEAGATPAVVVAEVKAAIGAWLATWGATKADDHAWIPKNTVRRLEVLSIAGSAPGVAYLSSLTINGVDADLALPGVAALPTPQDATVNPSTVTGTAV